MKKISPFIIPTVLCILSFLLRLSLISKGAYSVDCLHLALRAEKTLLTGQLALHIGFGSPLAVIFGAVFVYFARLIAIHDPVIAVNFMSVFFSSLCIPIFYYVAKKLTDDLTAFLGSIMLSISPIFLGISLFGKSHAPAMFFLLLSILNLLIYQKKFLKKNLVFAGISVGFVGAVRLQDALLMFLPLAFLLLINLEKKDTLFNNSKKNLISNVALFSLIAFSSCLIFYLPYLWGEHSSQFLSNTKVFWHDALPNYMNWVYMVKTLSNCYKFLNLTLTMPGGVIALLGLVFLLFRRRFRLGCFLLLWAFVPILCYSRIPTTVPRFLVVVLPPLIIAQSYLFGQLMSINTWIKYFISSVYILIVCVLFANFYPIFLFRHHNALLPDYARWVGAITEENAVVIIDDERKFISHYAERVCLTKPKGMFYIKDQDLKEFKTKLDDLLEQGIPVYATYPGLRTRDPQDQFLNLILDNYILEIMGTRPYEDWHRGPIRQQIYEFEFFRIREKP